MDQIHSKDALRVLGRDVPLLPGSGFAPGKEKESSNAY
jgi:hypothetical protein